MPIESSETDSFRRRRIALGALAAVSLALNTACYTYLPVMGGVAPAEGRGLTRGRGLDRRAERVLGGRAALDRWHSPPIGCLPGGRAYDAASTVPLHSPKPMRRKPGRSAPSRIGSPSRDPW